MNPLIRIKTTPPLLITLTLLCIGLLPKAEALVPPPDGGYPGGNTAEGQAALLNLTTGGFNTAVGFLSLRSDTIGAFNTAVGAGTLLFNVGDGAGAGTQNTAVGVAALLFNTGGSSNTAVGTAALLNNTEGNSNTATGVSALNSNTTGANNTANGTFALFSNTSGAGNMANGVNALDTNTTGSFNTALGVLAGMNQTTGSNNVYIGAEMFGVPGESDACYIKSIFLQTSAAGIPVLINSNNKLGTTMSSKRFKHEIKSMDKDSEVLFALKPVTFRYKKDIDPAGTRQLGLVAEDVQKVNPDLVVRDKDGKPYSVRYDQVNAMLLNEFLKEHEKVQELEKQVEKLTVGLQKVSVQVEASKPAPQVVNNP